MAEELAATHIQIDPLDEIKDDILTSKLIIEEITGKEVFSFCFSFSDYTRKAIDINEDAGFIYAAAFIKYGSDV